MCSITINATVEEQLIGIGRRDKDMVEGRLGRMAGEANVNSSGGLDTPDTHMRRMPAALRDARKKRIGRHRVYYTGFHVQCTYRSFYIKANKKDDVDREDDRSFQDILIRALADPPVRTLPDPTQPITNEPT